MDTGLLSVFLNHSTNSYILSGATVIVNCNYGSSSDVTLEKNYVPVIAVYLRVVWEDTGDIRSLGSYLCHSLYNHATLGMIPHNQE